MINNHLELVDRMTLLGRIKELREKRFASKSKTKMRLKLKKERERAPEKR